MGACCSQGGARVTFVRERYNPPAQPPSNGQLPDWLRLELGRVHRGIPAAIEVDIRDFTRATNGKTDATSDIQKALNSLGDGQALNFAGGTYLVSSTLTRTGLSRLQIRGRGAKFVAADASITSIFDLEDCDQLVFADVDFDGVEDYAYFSANSPSTSRQFLLLTSCSQPTIKGLTGRNKRRFLFLSECDGALVSGIQFTGFFQDVSSGAQANANNAPVITFSDCDHYVCHGVNVDHHGSAVLNALDGAYFSITDVVGRELHDNGVYVSSGHDGYLRGVMRNVVGSGIKARGFNHDCGGVFDNCDEAGILLTGNGASVDAFGANGYNLRARGVATGCNIGCHVKDQDGEYPRDVDIDMDVYNSTGTGNNAPVNAIVVRGLKVRGIIRTTAADYGVLCGGVDSSNKADEVDVDVVVSDVNGSAAATRGGVRLQNANASRARGIFHDIASGIGVRASEVTDSQLCESIYDGGQVVRCPTSENNTGNLIDHNTGATIVVDGANNRVGDHNITTGAITSAAASPAQITADQNDYAITLAVVHRLTTDAARNITGFVAGADLRPLEIWNVGSQNIVLQNQNAGSAAANRIITGTGADITVVPDDVVRLRYDAATARWRVGSHY